MAKKIIAALVLNNLLPLGILVSMIYFLHPRSFRLFDLLLMVVTWFSTRRLIWLGRRRALLMREQSGQTV